MTTQITRQGEQAGTGRTTLTWWLGGGILLVSFLVLTFVLSNGLFSEQPAIGTAARPLNRIFADEQGYIPALEEYQAMLLEPLSVPAPAPAQTGNRQAAPADQPCRLISAASLTLCLPAAVPQSQVVSPLNGPR